MYYGDLINYKLHYYAVVILLSTFPPFFVLNKLYYVSTVVLCPLQYIINSLQVMFVYVSFQEYLDYL